jgi:hypothetical protein
VMVLLVRENGSVQADYGDVKYNVQVVANILSIVTSYQSTDRILSDLEYHKLYTFCKVEFRNLCNS